MYTRLRSRGGLTAGTSVNTQLKYNAPSTVSTASGQESGVVEVMEDVCTPGFRKLSSAGKFVNSPMIKTRLAVTSLPRDSSWVWRKKPGETWYPQEVGGTIGFSINDPLQIRHGVCKSPFTEMVCQWNGTLAGIALANARSKAADSSAALLVTLGEARETLGLIGNMLDLLRGHATPFFKLQRRFHRGELRPADFLREMSETWLLYRYGLTPLFYELEGYVKALSGDAEKKRETSRGKHADSGQRSWSYQLKSDMIKNVKVEWSMNWTDTYRATCVYEYLDDLQSRLGMRWADVPLAAHELTRLSFVADWFVNIGEFLSSITLAARANVLLQCVSRRFEGEALVFYSEHGSVELPTVYSECLSNGTGAQVLFSYTRKERRPYPNDSVGSLSPRIALNAKRLADAAALLATAFDVKGLRARNVRI